MKRKRKTSKLPEMRTPFSRMPLRNDLDLPPAPSHGDPLGILPGGMPSRWVSATKAYDPKRGSIVMLDMPWWIVHLLRDDPKPYRRGHVVKPIRTIKQLQAAKPATLLGYKGIGYASLKLIRDALLRY